MSHLLLEQDKGIYSGWIISAMYSTLALFQQVRVSSTIYLFRDTLQCIPLLFVNVALSYFSTLCCAIMPLETGKTRVRLYIAHESLCECFFVFDSISCLHLKLHVYTCLPIVSCITLLNVSNSLLSVATWMCLRYLLIDFYMSFTTKLCI